MEIVLLFILIILGNAVLGSIILATIDRDKALFTWFKESRSEIFKFLVLELWPVVLFFYFRKK